MSTYVLVFGKLRRLEDQDAFAAAFKQVSHTLLNSVDGILRDELIQDANDPSAYILLSEWIDKDAWANWQKSPIHEEQVGHLQQYWQGQGVKILTSVYRIGVEEARDERRATNVSAIHAGS